MVWQTRRDPSGLGETTESPALRGNLEETVVRAEGFAAALTKGPSVATPQPGGDDAMPRELGRYLVVRQLGAGGMGVVYAAYDPELDRKVAIKLLHCATAGEAQTRLLREAQAMAKLSHPNVVPVYDVGMHCDNQVFIAMDLVEGTDLREWLTTPRPWQDVVDVFTQAGAGLAAAHAAGLIHRDFKPDNVLLRRDPSTGQLRAQVADFGLARRDEDPEELLPTASTSLLRTGHSALDVELTGIGTVIGTPVYMSPEQHRGWLLDARSDQFSFCVALFEALYGVRPYTGKTREELAKQAHGNERSLPPRGRKVPGWLYRLCLRGLAADRDARFPRMEALLAELQAGRERGPRRLRWGLAAALVVGAAGGTAWAMTGPGVCEGAAAQVAAVWQPERDATVAAAFAGTGLPYASAAWTGAARAIDDYVGDWQRMYTEACVATQVRGEQSSELMDLRMACLYQRLGDLDALLKLFADADKTSVKRASEAVYALPSLHPCADLDALRSGVAAAKLATDPSRSAALRERLRTVRMQVNAGKSKQAVPELEALVSEARALADPQLTAATLLALARAQTKTGADEDARKTMATAVWQAIADRDDETLWDALLEQMFIVGYKLGRKADAMPWIDHAEAVLRRDGQPDRKRGAWLHHLGLVEVAAGDHAGAVVHLAEAVTVAERAHGQGHARLINPLNALGAAHLRSGAYSTADAVFARAISIAETVQGPDHPDLAMPLNNLALCRERQGRYAEAIAALQRSKAILAGINPKDPNVALLRQNIGGMMLIAGQAKPALLELEAAREHLEEALGPEHPAIAGTYTFLGDVWRELADPDAARTAYRHSCELRERALGADHPDRSLCLLGLARVELDAGNAELALGYVDHALKTVAASSPDPGDLGLMHMVRAMTLRKLEDNPESIAAARAAREALVTAGPAGERGLAELAAWESTR